jgi:hypothetical protein
LANYLKERQPHTNTETEIPAKWIFSEVKSSGGRIQNRCLTFHRVAALGKTWTAAHVSFQITPTNFQVLRLPVMLTAIYL